MEDVDEAEEDEDEQHECGLLTIGLGKLPPNGEEPELNPSSLLGRPSRGESLRPREDEDEDSQEVFNRELGEIPPDDVLIRSGGC